MGYTHMFYGLDLGRLRSIYGSGDETFLAEVLQAQAEQLENNDGFFDVQSGDGDFPNSETALRDIVFGLPKQHERVAAMYGYVLKILCEHIGEAIGDDVAAVKDHPYKAQLASSGPPIPIPDDPTDFPEIGFIALSDIPDEIKRIDSAPSKAKRSFAKTILSSMSRGMIGRQMSDEETAEDMAAYRATLQEALDKGVSIVSFRH